MQESAGAVQQQFVERVQFVGRTSKTELGAEYNNTVQLAGNRRGSLGTANTRTKGDAERDRGRQPSHYGQGYGGNRKVKSQRTTATNLPGRRTAGRQHKYLQ